MCKASITAEHVIDACEGQSYAVGVSSHGLGALHPIDSLPTRVVACVKDGTTVTLSQIPPDLQAAHGLGPSEIATFIDKGHFAQDALAFEEKHVPLVRFANRGVNMLIGVPKLKLALTSSASVQQAAPRELVDA
jgi:hypothetical protein